jgi:hypothetical protein
MPEPEPAQPPEQEPDVAGPPAPEPAAPSVPAMPQPDPNVLPRLSDPAAPHVAGGQSRMTLMEPVGAEEENDTDWAVVIGASLVAEIGLLWGAACIALWRRRIRLSRATSGTVDDGPV